MKKTVLLLLIVSFVFCVCACEKKEKRVKDPTTNNLTSPISDSEEEMLIGSWLAEDGEKDSTKPDLEFRTDGTFSFPNSDGTYYIDGETKDLHMFSDGKEYTFKNYYRLNEAERETNYYWKVDNNILTVNDSYDAEDPVLFVRAIPKEGSNNQSTNNSSNINGNSIGDEILDDINEENYSICEFLSKFDYDNPLILYAASDISKDARVVAFYVIMNGSCRQYNYIRRDLYNYDNSYITLGDLSKLSDTEILELLNDSYSLGLKESRAAWRNLIDSNKLQEAKIQSVCQFDIESYVLTDDTGNRIIKEVLLLPKLGVGDNSFVLYLPDSDSPDFLNYYKLNWKKDSFSKAYFNTGYGIESDINKIIDCFCFSNDFIIRKDVYSSKYIGLRPTQNTCLIFRYNNAEFLNLYFDSMDSSYVKYIDPKVSDLESLANYYYNNYYYFFTSFE